MEKKVEKKQDSIIPAFTLDLKNYPYPSSRMPLLAKNVVATSQPLAVQAGIRMFEKGGNAVDAALAAAISLTVVEPTGNGIGSDAFAIVWDGKKLHGLNASGRSPKSWSPERFDGLDAMPLTGWDSVTVPGAVDAWGRLSERFGVLPFDTLFESAIRYAEEGFMVSPVIAAQWAEGPSMYRDVPEFARAFLPDGKPPEPGMLFRFPDQAKTLREIGKTRGESFYRGRLAKKMVEYSEKTGGPLTLKDLSSHRSEWVDPIHVDYHGVRIHEIPPNGQGLAALIALGILKHRKIETYPPDSPDAVHLQIEAMKIAFSEAFRHFADPSAMTMNPWSFLDETFLEKRASEIRMDQAAFPKTAFPPGSDTVYLTAADQNGIMVSFIQSNFMGFGSGVVIPGTGISLQGRGGGFSLEPGHPNRVAGGKKPYHTIIPGFVTIDGKPLMSFGVMGAFMQPQGHVQMVLRIIDYGQNPQVALDAPRWRVFEQDFHPGLEKGFDTQVIRELERRGHRVEKDLGPEHFGGGQIIFKTDHGYIAGSDPRKDGCASGF